MTDREQRLNEAIAAYVEAVKSGDRPDSTEFIARFPDVSDELRAFIADYERMNRMAAPFGPAKEPSPAEANRNDVSIDRDAVTLPPSSLVAPAPESSDDTPELSSSGPQPSTLDAQPSTRLRYFGDYELIEEIARGGMGVVYKARQVSLNRIVAVKMILAGQLAGPDDVRRFRTEAEAAAQLQHPNIVAIHEVGEHDGQHYFSMDYIEGTSLAAVVRENPLPAKQAAAIVKTVAEAIHYAHTKGILHRDLKPSNILLQNNSTVGNKGNEDSAKARRDRLLHIDSSESPSLTSFPSVQSLTPKVTDFGLAKRIEGGSELTGTGQILGTPSYMPPEQAGAKRGEIGPASDVYSLGAILYELLTGRPPFRAETPLDTLLQVLDSEPVAPRLLNPKLPRDLETICLKCLSKPPAQRYGTAADLSDDLRRYLAGQPIHARPITSTERLWRWCRRNPVVATMTAAIAMVLVLGAVISSYFAVLANAEATKAIAQKKRADDKADLADTKASESRRHLYVAHMNLGQNAWEANRVGGVVELLERYRHPLGVNDPRGFEWYYWDRLVQTELLTLTGHADEVLSASFSPTGQQIASAGGFQDGTVRIWDIVTGQEIRMLKGTGGWVWSVSFSPDGRRLAAACDGNVAVVWNAETGEQITKFKGHTSTVKCVSFSPDGRQLASAGQDSTVRLWDVETGEEINTMRGHSNFVESVSFSPDGQWLVSGGSDRTVRLWDVKTAREIRVLKGHLGCVTNVSFGPSSQRLASASSDNTVRIWDTATGQVIWMLGGHNGPVHGVSFSMDGRQLVSASSDQTLKVWDVDTGHEIRTLRGHTDRVQSASFSPDSRLIASASADKTIKVWISNTEQGGRRLGWGDGQCVSFSPDDRRVVVTSNFGVSVLDVETAQLLGTLEGHTNGLTSVAFSPTGRMVASGCYDKTVRIWDSSTYQQIRAIRAHNDSVHSVCFSPDSHRLASASKDRTVKVWNAETGQEIRTFKGHTGAVRSVAFGPDGRLLASTSEDRTVKVWDTETGHLIHTLVGHTSDVWCVSFSRDGGLVASASMDRSVRLWDTESGHGIRLLKGHTDRVASVSFSPDGRRLISTSFDQTVKFWDCETGQEILTLKGHNGEVWSNSVSSDGLRLVSANRDGSVTLWDARPWTPELRVEQEALSLVRFYSTPPIAKDKLMARIRADATISEAVRERALEFARQWKTE